MRTQYIKEKFVDIMSLSEMSNALLVEYLYDLTNRLIFRGIHSNTQKLPPVLQMLDSRIRCSCRSACVSGVVVFHCMVLKLQKPSPIVVVRLFIGTQRIR